MGLLDDAIREHLELKRRHGADENEVTRLETEAFGPARAPAPAEPAPEEPAAQEPVGVVEPAAAEEPAAVPEDPEPPQGDALEEVVAEQPPEPEPPEPEPPEPAGFTGDDPWLDDHDEVPDGERLDHPRRQPTTEFTPEDHAAARGESGYVAPDEEPGEDLLEETPEFLQETPEHDRLWFEQKPPKDFDFGG